MKTKESIIKSTILIINVIIFYYLIFVNRNQYLYNMSYLKCIVFMLINAIFLYFYGIFNNDEKTYKLNILIYIALYFALLFTITFVIGRTEFRFYNWWYAGQYEPFYTIISQFKYGSIVSMVKNILGNSIMLVPLSLLLMLKNKKFDNVLKQYLIILPVTVVIELLQAFTHTGAFDIDDILLNYIGTIFFTFIITRFNIMDKIRKIFYTDFKLKFKIKYILFYASLLIIILFDIVIFIR